MSWLSGSFMRLPCKVSAIAAPPLPRAFASFVVRLWLPDTVDPAMPTIGTLSAAVNFSAALKTFGPFTFGEAQGCTHRPRSHALVTTCYLAGRGRLTPHSIYPWKRLRATIHLLHSGSSGPLERQVKHSKAALTPATALGSFDSSFAWSVHTFKHGGLSAERDCFYASIIWPSRAAQPRSVSQYMGTTCERRGGPAAARSSGRHSLISADHNYSGPEGSLASRNITKLLLKQISSTTARALATKVGVSKAYAADGGQLEPAFAGCSTIRHTAVAASRQWIERDDPLVRNLSSVFSGARPAADDYHLRTAAKTTSRACLRVPGYSSLCSILSQCGPLFHNGSARSYCAMRSLIEYASINDLLFSETLFLNKQCGSGPLLLNAVASTGMTDCPTFRTRCYRAFCISTATVVKQTVLHTPAAHTTAPVPALHDVSTPWSSRASQSPRTAPPLAAAVRAGTAACGRRARESKSLAKAPSSAGFRGTPGARTYTTNVVTPDAMAFWVKTVFTCLPAVLWQQRWAASFLPSPVCRTIYSGSTYWETFKPQSSMQPVDGWYKRRLAPLLFWVDHHRRYNGFLMAYSVRHSRPIERLYFWYSPVTSCAEAFVFKRETTHVAPLVAPFRPAAPVVGIQCMTSLGCGTARVPATTASHGVLICAATDVISSSVVAQGRKPRYYGDSSTLYTATTRSPSCDSTRSETWLALNNPLRKRSCSFTAGGQGLCGYIPSSISADQSIPPKAVSSNKSIAEGATAKNRQLPTQKRLLSFEACSVGIPHPSKRGKGGEDASTCSPRLLVVADGVGGWGMSGVDAGLYSRELVQRLRDVFEECCEEKQRVQQPQQQQQQPQSGVVDSATRAREGAATSDTSLHQNNPCTVHERTPDPVQLLKAAYLTTRAIGSCTCCLVVLDRVQRRVRCANIGDSGFILYRPSKDTIIARSDFQSHDFNFPLQLGTGSSDMPEHAHVLEIPVQEGDVFLLATDGVWDNLYDEQVLKVFRRNPDVQAAAEELSQLAFKCSQDPSWNSPFATKEREVLGLPGKHTGGKPDDITVIVAALK